MPCGIEADCIELRRWRIAAERHIRTSTTTDARRGNRFAASIN
jgi:hypothetical protein